jgi:hypothetical protein
VSTLETVGVIVAVSLAMTFVIPLFVFLIFKLAASGYVMGKYRAEQLIRKEQQGGKD